MILQLIASNQDQIGSVREIWAQYHSLTSTDTFVTHICSWAHELGQLPALVEIQVCDHQWRQMVPQQIWNCLSWHYVRKGSFNCKITILEYLPALLRNTRSRYPKVFLPCRMFPLLCPLTFAFYQATGVEVEMRHGVQW